jgi:hypothetical protein
MTSQPVRNLYQGVFMLCLLALGNVLQAQKNSLHKQKATQITPGFTDATAFGFSPAATGSANAIALQKAVDKTGTIVISQPGTYKLAGTVYIGSNTSLLFGNNVFIKKVDEKGVFTHVLLNKGALTKQYDEHISIEGLNIIVNGIDKPFSDVYGLRGQLAFFYAKDVKIARFRCEDITKMQFAIHVCTFEDLLIDDVIIKGEKDGVHLGRGKRFTIRNGVFKTFDDAIALNAHDYATGNPELGWIEDGVVENCYDLNAENTTGYFCRILAGAWIDWKPGMEVQQSDAVVSNGRIYRVQAKPDGTIYKSLTQPTHTSGMQELDSIKWGMVQNDVTYTVGVRNVSFNNIFLYKPRTAFSVHFDNDRYSRSYYPGAQIPQQQNLKFNNINIFFEEKRDFLSIATPVDVISIYNSSLKDNRINFYENKAMSDYLKTSITITNCTFNHKSAMELLVNTVNQKKIVLTTSGNVQNDDNFSAKVITGNANLKIESDLTGLKDK